MDKQQKQKFIDSFPIVKADDQWNKLKKKHLEAYSIMQEMTRCPKELRTLFKWVNENSLKVAKAILDDKPQAASMNIVRLMIVPRNIWSDVQGYEKKGEQFAATALIEIAYATYSPWVDKVIKARLEEQYEMDAIELLASKGYTITKNK